MIGQITQPLLQQSGIEALRDGVFDSQAQLHTGLLRDPWEVEVMLISNGKVRAAIWRNSLQC